MSDEADELFSGRPGDDVDELFGTGAGTPAPRTGTILSLMGGGVLLGVLGLACTSVPGGMMVLLAWMLVEKESDRIDSGYLPETARRRVGQLQILAYLSVSAVILLFVAQAYLFCSGGYDALWGRMLAMYMWFVGAPLPGV